MTVVVKALITLPGSNRALSFLSLWSILSYILSLMGSIDVGFSSVSLLSLTTYTLISFYKTAVTSDSFCYWLI